MYDNNEIFENALMSLRKAFRDYSNGLLENIKQITPDFNAFRVLYALELPLSRIIGELLNPNGTHAQGRSFLDLFIDMFLNNRLFLKKIRNVNLKLEHAIPNKERIDILLNFNREFGISIENKPFAIDQESQIRSYCEYMSKQYGEKAYYMLYFSRDGSLPSEKSISKNEIERLGSQFVIISYRQIREWFNKCAAFARKTNATRLAILIEELSEYISRECIGENTLKNKMLGETIEKYILEAFEINSLWQNNQKEFETYWRNKINHSFNEKLPALVFEILKKDGVIDEEWEWIKGNFDINTLHLEGFGFKKKKWKHFKIAVISDRFKTEKGKRGIFPAIISREKIHKKDYIKEYSEKTGCEPILNPFLKLPPTQWYAVFPDADFETWGYEQWAGIKPDGPTVNYIANFLKKLIKACVIDIDTEEKRLK
jgi:hypothetical protein